MPTETQPDSLEPRLSLEVVVDDAAPAGDVLGPLAALLLQLAEREPAEGGIHAS